MASETVLTQGNSKACRKELYYAYIDWLKAKAVIEDFPSELDPVELLLAMEQRVESLSLEMETARQTEESPDGHFIEEFEFWKWMAKAKRERDSKKLAAHRLRKQLGIDILSLRNRVKQLELKLGQPEKPDLQAKVDHLERCLAEKNAKIKELGSSNPIVLQLENRVKKLQSKLEYLGVYAEDRENKQKTFFECLYELYANSDLQEPEAIREKIRLVCPEMEKAVAKRLARKA